MQRHHLQQGVQVRCSLVATAISVSIFLLLRGEAYFPSLLPFVTHLVSTSFSGEGDVKRLLKRGSEPFWAAGVRCASSITLGVLWLRLVEQMPTATQLARL